MAQVVKLLMVPPETLKRLRSLPDQVALRAVNRSFARASASMRKVAGKEISRRITAPQKHWRKLMIMRRTAQGLGMAWVLKGKPIPLRAFRPRTAGYRARGPKYRERTVSIEIFRGKRKMLRGGVFSAKVTQGSRHLFRQKRGSSNQRIARWDKARRSYYPIEAPFGISANQVLFKLPLSKHRIARAGSAQLVKTLASGVNRHFPQTVTMAA